MGCQQTDDDISNLTNLTKLNCGYTHITDNGIKNMEKLQSLDISDYITDDGFMDLTNLQSLCTNKNTTNNCITKLTNLTCLNVQSSFIDDDGISYLKNLIGIHIVNQHRITLLGLQQLPRLTYITIN